MHKILEEALAKRDQFLKEHTEYQEYQDEIDRILDATPAEHRLEVMRQLICGKLVELSGALLELAEQRKKQ